MTIKEDSSVDQMSNNLQRKITHIAVLVVPLSCMLGFCGGILEKTAVAKNDGFLTYGIRLAAILVFTYTMIHLSQHGIRGWQKILCIIVSLLIICGTMWYVLSL
ncbi:MAG: hypothetical protein LBG99_09025 [Propionibacteriaceae bacterium]|jgi:hypothetical protein|nr:hypothetical protein [Propionibacteriaceae bacterium]